MSIIAEKIEPGYQKRWFKNSLLFIYNNPIIIALYTLTICVLGCLIHFTPLKHGLYFITLISCFYLTTLLYNLQYEISYKKVNFIGYFILMKESFLDIFRYFRASGAAQIIKVLTILSMMIVFDLNRERLDYPIVRTNGNIYYEDMILSLILSSSWGIILVENILMKTTTPGLFNKTAFSCDYILQKFSNFNKESSIQESIGKLLEEANEVNKTVNYNFCIFSHFFIFLFMLIANIHPLINLFMYCFFPILFFQIGKETFLDQGNRKNQKQEQEESSNSTVPDPSGA